MEESDVQFLIYIYIYFLFGFLFSLSGFFLPFFDCEFRFVFGWQKTTALKKAYAEIIINTAKESADRVMVSDRKSAGFHHDLSGTKEEALRLLVRLKQMIDAKVIMCSAQTSLTF